MPTDHDISKLIINKLTKEQYEQAVKSADELYLTPDTTDQDIANAVSAHNTSNSAHSDLLANYSTKAETVTDVVAGSTADKINVTKNGSTSTITVNNVASATKATQDGDGNTISSTYLKLTGGTLTGNLSFNVTDKATATIEPNVHGLYIKTAGLTLGINQEAYSGLYFYNGSKTRYIAFTDMKGVANGIASLDANTKVPVSQLPDLSDTYQPVGNYISYTDNTAVVAGTSKTVSKTSPEVLYVPNGLIMGGTAQEAGLVTRGICGVSSPTATGAATKDNLFVNYDGNNTYQSGRQLVLQAGSVGTHYGNNLYQYAAARGDAVKNYADATYAKVSHTHVSSEITDLSTTISTAIANKADKATTLSGYGITDAYTKTEVDGKLASGMHFKGTVSTYTALPASGNEVGDMWNVTDTGANYAWDGVSWDKLSENVDLSGLALKTEAAGSLEVSNATLTLKSVSGGTLSTVTVNNVANATTAANITYDTATSNSSRYVFFEHDSTTGRLVVNSKFKYNPSTDVLTVGSITGTAAKATADASGNIITTTYAMKSELTKVKFRDWGD